MLEVNASPWFIFTTAPKRESLVRKLLSARGIEALAPQTRTFEVISRKRIIARTEPVFPRYVFARASYLPGVPFVTPSPLSMNGRPYQLSDKDSATVRDIQVDSPKGRRPIEIGADARVTSGILSGCVVRVQSLAKERAKVVYSERVIEVPIASLEAA